MFGELLAQTYKITLRHGWFQQNDALNREPNEQDKQHRQHLCRFNLSRLRLHHHAMWIWCVIPYSPNELTPLLLWGQNSEWCFSFAPVIKARMAKAPLTLVFISMAKEPNLVPQAYLSIRKCGILPTVAQKAVQQKQAKSTAIKPGVNLLVASGKLEDAKSVYRQLQHSIGPEQIILIPQRFSNTPTPKELADVAGGRPFQSPSCLLGCQPPRNFCTVSWDKRVNYCSYAGGKENLETLDFFGLMKALSNINFRACHQWFKRIALILVWISKE